jgi:hypothetical protein
LSSVINNFWIYTTVLIKNEWDKKGSGSDSDSRSSNSRLLDFVDHTGSISLDKEQTIYDSLDVLGLSLKGYDIK